MGQVLKIFCVYDKKASSHGMPFCSNNKAQALRSVNDEMRNSDSILRKYPSDFSVWCLGEFNLNSGVITPLAKPEFLDECANLNESVK